MERLTYRDVDGKSFLRRGLDAIWNKIERYEVIKKAVNRLAEYEDLEETRLLLRLPCKVGDTVYEIHPLTGLFTPRIITGILICNSPNLTIFLESGNYTMLSDKIGKTIFLTQLEAEQKLKEMESD